MGIKDIVVNELKIIGKSKIGIQYAVVGAILTPLSLASYNNLFGFLLMFCLGTGCFFMSLSVSHDEIRKRELENLKKEVVKNG